MSKKPTLIAYTIKERGDGQNPIWTRIGAAWPDGSGAGLTLQLDSLPLDGRVVLTEPNDEIGPLREHPCMQIGGALPCRSITAARQLGCVSPILRGAAWCGFAARRLHAFRRSKHVSASLHDHGAAVSQPIPSSRPGSSQMPVPFWMTPA